MMYSERRVPMSSVFSSVLLREGRGEKQQDRSRQADGNRNDLNVCLI